MAHDRSKQASRPTELSSVAKRQTSAPDGAPKKLSRVRYEAELLRLQGELVAVQEWKTAVTVYV